jgi:hypothetical protein
LTFFLPFFYAPDNRHKADHLLVNPRQGQAAAGEICTPPGDQHARDKQRPARARSDQDLHADGARPEDLHAGGQIGRDPTGICTRTAIGPRICTQTVRPDQIEDSTGAAICPKNRSISSKN